MIDFKKGTKLGKMFFAKTRKLYLKFQVDQSEFLNSELKSVMREIWLYIKHSGYFTKKLKNIYHIPQDAIIVTADAVGLYHRRWSGGLKKST